jgi:hypothetical protein
MAQPPPLNTKSMRSAPSSATRSSFTPSAGAGVQAAIELKSSISALPWSASQMAGACGVGACGVGSSVARVRFWPMVDVSTISAARTPTNGVAEAPKLVDTSTGSEKTPATTASAAPMANQPGHTRTTSHRRRNAATPAFRIRLKLIP